MSNQTELAIIEKKSNDVVVMARKMVINCQEAYNKSAEALKGIKLLKKEVDDTFDTNISDANKLHKGLVASKKKHYEPLTLAESIWKQKTLDFVREEQRKQKEEQDKIDAEAKKAEDKRKADLEAQAKKWEEKGNTDKAEERREQAEQVHVPVPVVQETFEKASGQAIKKIWSCEVMDMNALCKAIADGLLPAAMVKPDMANLNGLARTMQNTKTYPGIKFVSKDNLAVR